VIGVSAYRHGDRFAGLVRIDRRGRIVRGFGRAGAVRPRVDGRLLGLFAHRGRIVAVSDNEYAKRSPGGVELRAFRADGSPDRAYGRRGLATGGVDQPDHFHPVAAVQQPNDRIVVAGSAWGRERSQAEVMRFR
jgi:hypothetical protein